MLKPVKDQLNRPIHDLRISVIDRCNFRCTYCMPEKEYSKHYSFLEPAKWLTFDEIERVTRVFVNFGVKKVRITGGEPLLRPNIDSLIRNLSKIPDIEDLALTTNGSHLRDHAHLLKKAGLNRLTISLDTLDCEIFKAMSGNKGCLDDVLAGIKEAQKAGFEDIKLNTVIQKGVNDSGILNMIEYFKNTNVIIRFIEYMDVGNCNHWSAGSVVPSKEILEQINQTYPLEPIDANYFGEVAKRYRFKDGVGEIGFISSVTQPFCGSCTRARLSTDGQIYTCLFSDDGKDIRTALRYAADDTTLSQLIQSIWEKRSDRYSELRNEFLKSNQATQKVEMFQIGG